MIGFDFRTVDSLNFMDLALMREIFTVYEWNISRDSLR